jgi:hypothetical protein
MGPLKVPEKGAIARCNTTTVPPLRNQRSGLSGPEEDQCYRQAVLTLLLDLHPSQLSSQELDRELEPEGRCAEIDTVKRAVDFLVRVGLLRREGTSVLPTRAALVFEELVL